ncbi:MAG: response regulator [Opitutaceae bacterium]|nr:response regulator [Opitutaceae bacterium]
MSETPPSADPTQGTILLVDDTPASLRFVAEHLEVSGYRVMVAEEGGEAIERARLVGPDLILLDIMMPGLDGITVCRRLKEDPVTAVVPVIFLTSLSQSETIVSGFAAGGVDFLSKPVQLDELLARVRAHIALRRLQGELEARVEARTRELGAANQRLRDEAAERERAQATLRASEERYRELYENNPAMYFTVDTEGRILSANRFGAEQLGYTVDELLGSPVVNLFHPDDRDAALRQVGICVAEPGRMFSWELRKVRRDGSGLWVKELARAVARTGGGMVIFIVCEDITARRQLEAQLRQAQKMEAFGQLAGGVAHDFNNILSVVLGQAELALEDRAVPGGVREALLDIREASLRARNLTRQLLVFSRRQEMQFEAVDLNAVVTDVAGLLGRLIGENIALELQLCPDRAPVVGDPGMLGQVIVNIAVNARDAMPAGGRLTITTARQEVTAAAVALSGRGAPGEYVVLGLGDTGTGMPAEVQARIFEPFFTTKEVGQGTGLGLATSLSIVQQHGGWIDVESEPGQGALFRIFVPCRTSAGARLPRSGLARPVARASQGTVLLVEDETSVRRVATRSLERLGYRVIEASDGEEAIEAWHEHREQVDLVLTDIVMPGKISGRALARRLREEAPGIRIALMTGYDPEVLAQKLADQDRDLPHIQKPFTVDALAEFIRRVLGR